ncbi:MAG: histidine kinase, partial [Bryobacteraceae bacterium]
MHTLTVHEPLLVNTLGHFTGAVVFGIFLVLLLRDRSGTRLRGSRTAIAAASLAFLWNLASFWVLATPELPPALTNGVAALSYAALSLLPAVLLHLSLDGQLRPIVISGYLLSLMAIALHLAEFTPIAPQFHGNALALITWGFGLLTVISVIRVLAFGEGDGRRAMSRTLGAMSLFLFSISFIHFREGAPPHGWSREILLHHAGIPLALFILLQDYRFVLLDAFIRFLANILLAAVFTFAAVKLAGASVFASALALDPVRQALLLVGSCLLLVLCAVVRSRVQTLLTRIIFRRPELEKTMLRPAQGEPMEEPEYIRWSTQKMAEFVRAPLILPVPSALEQSLHRCSLIFPVPSGDLPALRESLEALDAEAVVPLHFSQAEVRYALLGRREAGRRYLSEDLQALARLATQIVDQVKLFRESELHRLVTQAELRALHSQIHPHFLFNVLNTLYGVIPREAAGARRTVLNLADIFRYFL